MIFGYLVDKVMKYFSIDSNNNICNICNVNNQEIIMMEKINK